MDSRCQVPHETTKNRLLAQVFCKTLPILAIQVERFILTYQEHIVLLQEVQAICPQYAVFEFLRFVAGRELLDRLQKRGSRTFQRKRYLNGFHPKSFEHARHKIFDLSSGWQDDLFYGTEEGQQLTVPPRHVLHCLHDGSAEIALDF
jgi:hypothetical protein